MDALHVEQIEAGDSSDGCGCRRRRHLAAEWKACDLLGLELGWGSGTLHIPIATCQAAQLKGNPKPISAHQMFNVLICEQQWQLVEICGPLAIPWRYRLTPVSCCPSLIMIPGQSMSNCSHYRTPADICTSRCTKTNKSIYRPDPSLSVPDTRSIHIFVQKEKYLLLKDTKNNYLFFIHMTKKWEGKKKQQRLKLAKNIDLFGIVKRFPWMLQPSPSRGCLLYPPYLQHLQFFCTYETIFCLFFVLFFRHFYLLMFFFPIFLLVVIAFFMCEAWNCSLLIVQ